MSLVPFDLVPSVVKDDSAYASKGRVIETDKVRWHRADGSAKPHLESIGGWERVITTQLDGVCRGICTYADNTPTPIIGLGTHKRLYAITDYTLYDITPNRLIAVRPNPVTTVANSNVVTVSHTAHGASVGDQVSVFNATTVNGITVTGAYPVASVVDANSYTIMASNVANAAGSGGGTVVLQYQIPIGLPDSLGGAGYGTGGYGAGTYSTPSTGASLKARTWSMFNWGNRMVASPAGGAVYEFQPSFAAASYVTNGSFTADANWTKGTGWTISGGNAVHAASNATALSQAVGTTLGGFYRLVFDATVSAGTLQPSLGGGNIGSAISASGHYVVTFLATGIGSLALTADSSFAGSITNVALTVENVAYQIPNAPTANLGMFVTPENFMVLLGTTDATGAYSPMTIRWCDQANDQQWAPLATNQARDTILRGGSRLIAGRPVKTISLIWSDTGVFGMRYSGDPSFVYALTLLATNCGLIGPNAVAVLDGTAYWMTPTGRIMQYYGGVVQPVDCPLQVDTFTNLAPVQQEKIFASVVNFAGGVEIQWQIPDGRDGTECSRYIAYNPTEGAWSSGMLARTAATPGAVLPYPIAVDPAGNVYFHEKGNTADGGLLYWRFKTAPIELGNGDHLMMATRMLGDWASLVGGATLTLYSRNWPQDTDTILGIYPILPTDLHSDFVVTARQIAIEFMGNAAPAKMRIGGIRFDLEDTGMTL
ncbi:hypothetical protein [Telmatospirillum sp.]|uniref:hypothetical protein n=1 Tax=Telmatospirillum sp. TaxID=2079197 RepID=UPI00284EECEC|nr:hypothetical protein [Telmatospirillum sp.]MDR3439881.1 hypothetical protein [Telmatospirillum sp.]